MKKGKEEVKKLRLTKETLRALKSSEIQGVVGGTEVPSCNSWCICPPTRTDACIIE